MPSRGPSIFPLVAVAAAIGVALVAQQLVAARPTAPLGWIVFLAAGALLAVFWPAPAPLLAGEEEEEEPRASRLWPLWAVVALGLLGGATGLSVIDRLPILALALWLASLGAATAAVRGRRLSPAARPRIPWSQAEVLRLAAILVAALAARTVWLHSVPPYIFGDEPRVGIYLERIYSQHIPSFFSLGWNTWPVIGLTLQGLFAPLLGLSTTTLRLSSALMGTLAVLATYLLAREMFSARVALIAALLLAMCRTALDFSRLGICHAQVMLFEAAAFYLWWRAVDTGAAASYLWSGIALGLCYHTYNAGELAVPLWLVWVALCAVAAPRSIRTHWRGAALTLAGTLLATLPLILFVTDRFGFGPEWTQWTYMSRNRQVFTQMVAAWHAHGLDAGLGVLGTQAWRTWLGFSVIPAEAYHLGYRGGGMLDQVTGALFTLGLLAIASRFWRPRFAFLLLWWLATSVAGGVLTDTPPAFVRLVGMLPVLAIIAAFPVEGLLRTAGGAPALFRRAAAVAAAALLLAALALNLYTYFVSFPREEYDPMSELAHELQRLPSDSSSAILLGAEHFLHFTREEMFHLDFPFRDRTDVGEVAQVFPIHEPAPRTLGIILGPTQMTLSRYIESLYPGARASDVIRGRDHTLVFRALQIPFATLYARAGLSRRIPGEPGPEIADPFLAESGGESEGAARWTGQVYWPTSRPVQVQIDSSRPLRLEVGGQLVDLTAPGTTRARITAPRGWLPLTMEEGAGRNHSLRVHLIYANHSDDLRRWDLRPDSVWNGLHAEYRDGDEVLDRTIEPLVDLFAVETFFDRTQLPIHAPFTVTLSGGLVVEKPGSYALAVVASGPHRVRLDGRTILEVEDVVPENPPTTSVTLDLDAGIHPIEIDYDSTKLSHTTRRILQLFWTPPGGQRELIPPPHFVPNPPEPPRESKTRGRKPKR